MVWIAGGSGLSALKSMLLDMVGTGMSRKCTLYFGAVTGRDLYLLDELREIERENDWFTFIPALSAPEPDENWTGRTGLITDVLEEDLANAANMEAYICGSPGMINAAKTVLEKLNVPENQIFYDEFVFIG